MTKDLFYNDHCSSFRATCGLGRTTLVAFWLVLTVQQVALLTGMAKFCHAIRPPCRAKEPPPSEASSCLYTDFTLDIRRFQQLVVLLQNKVALLQNQFHFVIQLDRLPTKYTGWYLINEAVVLYRQMAKMCCLIWATK